MNKSVHYGQNGPSMVPAPEHVVLVKRHENDYAKMVLLVKSVVTSGQRLMKQPVIQKLVRFGLTGVSGLSVVPPVRHSKQKTFRSNAENAVAFLARSVKLVAKASLKSCASATPKYVLTGPNGKQLWNAVLRVVEVLNSKYVNVSMEYQA